ncbi:unnamed protein product [Alopecurus aequalis]
MVRSARIRQRVTRRQRDRAAVLFLSEDLVLWEIFYRLPAKALLRCRAVCRSWRRLTCDAEFLLAYHRRQPSLPLFWFSDATRSSAPATVDAFDLRQSPAVRRPILGFSNNIECCKYYIHASCDGLLLLSGKKVDKYYSFFSIRKFDKYYICNPATRQWCALPDVSDVAALYHHRPSGEYRVLYRKQHPDGLAGSVVYYVLTVGSSLEGQRCIGLPVSSPSLKKLMTDGQLDGGHPPVPLHDCLHWYSGSYLDNKGKVLVFHTVDESFRCMKPAIAGYKANLRQMDGTLYIRHWDPYTMIVQVWALQDYEMEVWSFKCKIQLPVLEIRKYFSAREQPVWEVVSDNGDMLITGHWSGFLLHCDSKGKLVDKFQKDFKSPGVPLSFKESFVRHAFFERKDHKRVKLVGFFRGL